MKINYPYLTLCLSLFVWGSVFATPLVTQAQTPTLGCNVFALSDAGPAVFSGEGTISAVKGKKLTLLWQGVNAQKAYDTNGKDIPLLGFVIFSPSESTSYTYNFYRDNEMVSCIINVAVVTGDITNASLFSKAGKPTIQGTVTGTQSVYLEIYQGVSKQPYFTTKETKVKGENWSIKLTKSLKDGDYTVVLRGVKGQALNTITSEQLVIGKRTVVAPALVQTSNTTFVAQLVPLLVGGTVTAGKNVPISYLQLINIGTTTGIVTGFTVEQTGNASVLSLATISVNSEQGNQATVSASLFKNNKLTLPVSVIIAPGQMQLFTLKAQLAANVVTDLTKQFKLDVTNVTTNARMQSAFPIRGTTWTVGL